MQHPNVYREKLFNEWFEIKTKRYEHERDGKSVDVYITVKLPPFKKTFDKVYKKHMRHYPTYWDCVDHCVGLIWQGLQNFKVENTTWEAIANGEDMDTYRQLLRYLMNYVSFEASKENRGYKCTSKRVEDEDGEKRAVSIFYKVDFSSTNLVISDEDNKEIEVGNTIEHSFWDKRGEHCNNDFVNWFKENIDNVLTNRQKEVLKELADDTNFNRLDDETYFYLTDTKRNSLYAICRRIFNLVNKAYDEETQDNASNFITRLIDDELETLNDFVAKVITGSNVDVLTMTVINHLDENVWDRIVYDKLSLEAQKDVIRVYNANVIDEGKVKLYISKEKLAQSTLDEIIDVVLKEIEFLNDKREYELEVLHAKLEAEKARKPKKRMIVPKDVKCIYVSIDTDGNWNINK